MMIDTSKSPPPTGTPRVQESATGPARKADAPEVHRERPEARIERQEQATQAVAERIRQYLRESSRELDFRIDADTGRTVVTVRDQTTGEVIRQIPPEEVLRIARSLSSPIERLVDLRA